MPKDSHTSPALRELVAILDAHRGRYRELANVTTLPAYIAAGPLRADEEILTEPILGQILERVLCFPVDEFLPQLGKSGLKPDFTPMDLVAHPFVLDAKSSDQRDLRVHERQIRGYVDQRGLAHGILFNLREVRVFRRGESGHDPALSFSLLPLWEYAQGAQLAGPEVAIFQLFCERFGFRELALADRITTIREQQPWAMRPGARTLEVDVDYLVERLRRLAERLTDDAAMQADELERVIALDPGREQRVVGELKLLALDLAPGTQLDELPGTLAEWRAGSDLVGRAWRQYLLRVAYLAVTRVLLYRAWEEVGFVDQVLFDGGFGTAYDEMGGNLRRVLQSALLRGGERYPLALRVEQQLRLVPPRGCRACRSFSTRSYPFRSDVWTQTCSVAFTRLMSTRSTGTASASSTRRGQSSDSCSTEVGFTGPRTGCFGSKATQRRARGVYSTSPPGRGVSSSKRRAASSMTGGSETHDRAFAAMRRSRRS